MSMEVHSYSVLLISASQKINAAIKDAVPPGKFEPVLSADNIYSAKCLMNERDFDLVILNSPLPDDSGIHFLLDASEQFRSTVFILLVRSETYPDIYDAMSSHGIFMLSKPLSLTTLNTCIQWIESSIARIYENNKKNFTLEEKMTEIRIVNRAKWLLIEKNNISETEAHKYIEQTAMKRCVSKKAIAEEILAQYD